MTEQIDLTLRAGMTGDERRALRARILDEYLERARRDAAGVHLSIRCLAHQPGRSPGMSGPQRRAEHVKCLAESMGDGCLGEWHDDEESQDVTESIEGPSSPAGTSGR